MVGKHTVGKRWYIRWNVLFLHAALHTKGPKYVVLPLAHIFPEACYLAENKMLHLHLVMIDTHTDEEVVKMSLQTCPAGVNAKENEGRPHIDIEGRPNLWVLLMSFTSTLLDERVLRTNEIKNLKEKIEIMSSEENMKMVLIVSGKNKIQNYPLSKFKILRVN